MTPLSIRDFLKAKSLAWFIPIVILAEVLLISGSLAVQAPPGAIVVTAAVGLALAVGIVGVGIGTGAVYSRFDWDSPAQVQSNFGSLIAMLISVLLIVLTMIPGGYLFILSSVPGMLESTSPVIKQLSLFCAFYLIFFINITAARTAMRAGAQVLQDLER